jgi:hypothetical protein
MNSFSKCIVGLFEEILHVDDTAMIAPLTITDNILVNFIPSKANLPTNFTKLGKYIMRGSWVFNKKEKGSNDIYAHFRLKSQVQAEDIVSRVSFEFNRLGGKNLYKKQHQAMETETTVMLLFVCNGNDQGSIKADTRQMLETALDDIKLNEMVPKDFKNRDIIYFTLKLSALQMPSESRQTTNKVYDHAEEHGKNALHFKVAKSDISYFKFLSSHTHRPKLDTKCFGKFAKFTATLSNNAPMSNCTCLCQCIQGYLNYHLRSTCITINGINTLDALELLTNPVNGRLIGHFSLWDLLYRIQLESKAPLFLQLSQQSSGEVNTVTPNTAEAELMAEKTKVQIAAWCHFYWRDTNSGADRFYCKLSDRAFSQVLLHKISKCT